MQTHPKLHILDFMVDVHDFSLATFGPGQRTEGVLKHIGKEIEEVRKDPDDIEEWIDLVILSLDGAMRQLTQGRGFQPYHAAETILDQWAQKTEKNMNRNWPDHTQFGENEAIEHVRDEDEQSDAESAITSMLEGMGLTVHRIEAVPTEQLELTSLGKAAIGNPFTTQIQPDLESIPLDADPDTNVQLAATYARMAAANAVQSVMAQREIEAMLEEARSMYDEVMPTYTPEVLSPPEQEHFTSMSDFMTETFGPIPNLSALLAPPAGGGDGDDDDSEDKYCFPGCPCQQMDEAEARAEAEAENEADVPPQIEALKRIFEKLGMDVQVMQIPLRSN